MDGCFGFCIRLFRRVEIVVILSGLVNILQVSTFYLFRSAICRDGSFRRFSFTDVDLIKLPRTAFTKLESTNLYDGESNVSVSILMRNFQFKIPTPIDIFHFGNDILRATQLRKLIVRSFIYVYTYFTNDNFIQRTFSIL